MGMALPSGPHSTEELCNYIQLFPGHNYILNRFPSDNFIYIFRYIFANFTSIPLLKQQRGISGPLKALRETHTMPKKGGHVSGGSNERGWWEVCNTLVWHKSLTGRCTLQSIYYFNLHCVFWLKKQKLWSGFLETYQCLEPGWPILHCSRVFLSTGKISQGILSSWTTRQLQRRLNSGLSD